MTRGIPKDPSLPPEPSKELTTWKSPTMGHPGRDPNCQLRLYFESQAPINPSSFSFASIFTRLIELFGEHPVRISSRGVNGENLKLLGQTGLDWKVRPYRHVIDTMSSWLTRPDALATIAPIFGSHGSFSASRGGGAQRHEVWELDWHDKVREWPSALTLSIATRHIANDQLPALHDLIFQFYREAASNGAHYGEGTLWRPRSQVRLATDALPYECYNLTYRSDRATVATVLWPKRFMLLGPHVMDKLGGLTSILSFSRKYDLGLQTQFHEFPNGRVFRCGAAPDKDDIDSREWERSVLEETSSLGVDELLYLFSKVGILDIQNMDWVPGSLQKLLDNRTSKKSSRAQQQRLAREQREATRALFADLRSRPPSCIRLTPKHVHDAKAFRRLGHNEEWVTAFDLRGRDDADALTLHGRPTSDKLILGSPIRAGSLDADRAALSFDAYLHGWDGAQVEPGAKADTPKLMQLKCPKCDGRHFRLRAFFEYADDTASSLDEKDLDRAEDFFTWFSLDARCVACSWKGTVADIETA